MLVKCLGRVCPSEPVDYVPGSEHDRYEQVILDGAVYQCLKNNTITSPLEDTKRWMLVSAGLSRDEFAAIKEAAKSMASFNVKADEAVKTANEARGFAQEASASLAECRSDANEAKGDAAEALRIANGVAASLELDELRNLANAASQASEQAVSTAEQAYEAAGIASDMAAEAKDSAEQALASSGSSDDSGDALDVANEARDIANNAREVADGVAEQIHTVSSTATSALEAANTAQETADATQEAVESMQEVVETAKDTADAAQEIANTAQETANTAQETADAAQEAVSGLSESIDDLLERLNAVGTSMESVNTSMQEVYETCEQAAPRSGYRGNMAGCEGASSLDGLANISAMAPDAINASVSGAVELEFFSADPSIYAAKTIALTAESAATLEVSGAVWAGDEAPAWGEPGDLLVINAQFIAGLVLLSVVYNDNVD